MTKLTEVFILKEAKCPLCGTDGAYQGLHKVECPNPKCKHYDPKIVKATKFTGNKKIRWNREFSAEYEPPKELLDMVRSGELDDHSWHNDTCPSFGIYDDNGAGWIIWSDAKDPERREMQGGSRFILAHFIGQGEANDKDFADTDDVREVIKMWREKTGK